MTELRIAPSDHPDQAEIVAGDARSIAAKLDPVGVLFRRWPTRDCSGLDQESVLSAYQPEIDALLAEGGYLTADLVSLTPNHPDHPAMRQKFLFEHTHSEDEVRFFVAGSGLFCMHIDGHVYGLTCTAGDLISVPKGTRHWFDMGPEPRFTCIRLFKDPSGWVAEATGSDIAERFPLMPAVG